MEMMEAEILEAEFQDNGSSVDDVPEDFRCPISKELMIDPVTISTGVSYERKNIEKWLFTYKKNTCPATMQCIADTSSNITPNHTLGRLIVAWRQQQVATAHRKLKNYDRNYVNSTCRDEMLSLLNTIQSSPFKITPMKKLQNLLQASSSGRTDDQMAIKAGFIRCGGVEVVVDHILVPCYNSYLTFQSDQMTDTEEYFANFRACEEALGVLNQLLLFSQTAYKEDDPIRNALQLLSRSESIKSIAIMLQKGSTEARLHAIQILLVVARFDTSTKCGHHWLDALIQNDHHEGIDLFKSLLELVSDGTWLSIDGLSASSSQSPSASSCALDLLIDILNESSEGSSSSSLSKKTKNKRLRAIEAGAICVLVELLPDSSTSKSRCEKILLLLKLLCDFAEGRDAFVEHAMGIAAVSKKLLRVSSTATKISVKVLYMISNCHPKEKVLEDMLVYGSVKKLLALLHMDGRSSTKDRVIRILKSHANSWQKDPCFPFEFRDHLGLVNH